MEPSPTKGSLDAKRTIGKSGIEEGALRKAQITEEQTQMGTPLSSAILHTVIVLCIYLMESWGEVSTEKKCGERKHT